MPPLSTGEEPDRTRLTAKARLGAAGALRVTESAASAFTSVGRMVAIGGLLAWAAGVRLGWEEFLLVAATCLLLLLMALAFTFGRMDVDVDVVMSPPRVVAGQTAAGQLTVFNTSVRRLLALRVELVVGRAVTQFDIPTLAGQRSHDELFVIPTKRRGIIAIGPARTLRGDPLGMLRRSLAWRGITNLYVHPVTTALDGIGAGLLRDLDGRTTDDTSTSDVELHTLRDYVPGDDRRFVHWRTSARSGTLMVRQFVDTRRSHVSLLQSAHPADYANDDEFELAVSVLASLGVRGVRDQQSIAISAAGRTIATTSATSVLDGASGIEQGGGRTSLADSAAQMARRNGDTTLAVLITGSTTPLEQIRAAAARFGTGVKVVAVRAASDSVSGIREIGGTTIMTLASLDDLPRLSRSVAQR